MKKLLTEQNTDRLVEILTVALAVFVGYLLVLNNTPGVSAFNNSDIHRGFQRAISVLNGVNPYLEFNPAKMLEQEKVPGFFPLYFYFMAVIAWLSHSSFVLYLDNLRYFVFIAYASGGVLIYSLSRKQNKLLALTGMLIYMFNRWTLNDLYDLKQDTYVLLILLLSLILLRRYTKTSFLLYGLATGIKHLTLLVAPIFVIELIMTIRSPTKEWKKAVLCSAIFLAPLVVPSVPYLIKTPKNLVYALMYNVTRSPEVSSLKQETGFDKLLVLYNQDRFNTPFFYALPRLPMLVMLVLVTILFFLKKLGVWQYCAYTYLIFVAFNPVLYSQYYTWLMMFLPLSLLKNDKI